MARRVANSLAMERWSKLYGSEEKGGYTRGHLHTDMTVRGAKAAVELKNVLIDTGATYTVLPKEVLEEVGAWGPMPDLEIE